MSSMIFKYAFLRNFRSKLIPIIVQFGIALIFGLVSRFLMSAQNMTAQIFGRLIYELSSSAISIIMTVIIIVSYVDFHKAIATDESYLTFTLPVTTWQQLFGRFCAILVWCVIAFASMLVCTYVFSLTSGVETEIFEISNIFEYGNASDILLDIEFVLLVLSASFMGLCEVVFIIVLGNRLSKKKKAGTTVGLFILFGFLEGLVLIALIIFAILFIGIDAEMWRVHVVLWLFALIALLAGVLMYYLAYNTLDKHLNVQ